LVTIFGFDITIYNGSVAHLISFAAILRGMGRAEGKREKTRKRPEDGGAFAIYNRVRVLRQERGLSQRELAEALGINYRTVGYLERQEYEPNLRLAYQIADFFGVPLEAVFSREPFPRMSEELYGRGER
jgi:putative transcriptional regulator